MSKQRKLNWWERDYSPYQSDFNVDSYFRSFNTNFVPIKRNEIIKPYVAYFEERRLSRINDSQYEKAREEYVKKGNGATLEGFNNSKKKLPQSFINDLFNLYYLSKNRSEISIEGNQKKYNILSKMYDYLHAVITQDKEEYSNIYVKNILQNIYLYATEEQLNDLSDSYNSEGDGEGDTDIDISAALQKALQEALNNSQQEIQKLKKSGLDPGVAAGTHNRFNYDAVAARYKTVATSSAASINNCINTILETAKDGSAKTFYIREEDEFMEAEHLEELFDIHFLNSKFKKAYLSDVFTETVRISGKIDVYMDVSGSMSESQLFATKRFCLALRSLNMLNCAYSFCTSLYELKTEEEHIKGFNTGGGTNFTLIDKKIKETQKLSIVLTDGGCDLSHFNPKCIYIGVEGAQFYGQYLDRYIKGNKIFMLDSLDTKTGRFNLKPYIERDTAF